MSAVADRLAGFRGPGWPGLLARLETPARFILANAAGLICALTVIGLVPGLVGVTRVVVDPEHRDDPPFLSVLAFARERVGQDWPVSLALVLLTGSVAGNIGLFTSIPPHPFLVFAAGLMLPVVGASAAVLSAYLVLAAAGRHRSRVATLAAAFSFVRAHPVRAALVLPVCVACLPVLLLPPLLIAGGCSVPAWCVAKIWYRRGSAGSAGLAGSRR